jgi:hypothetical protein
MTYTSPQLIISGGVAGTATSVSGVVTATKPIFNVTMIGESLTATGVATTITGYISANVVNVAGTSSWGPLSIAVSASVPSSSELIDYENEGEMRGGSGSTTTILCAWEDWQAVKAAYIDAIDPNDATLRIVKCHLGTFSKGATAAKDKARLTFQAIPLPLADAFRIDQPFQVKGRAFPMAFTVGGSYTWQSDSVSVDTTNTKILPVKEFTRADLILYGRLSTFSISTYSTYFDTVNANAITDGKLAGDRKSVV